MPCKQPNSCAAASADVLPPLAAGQLLTNSSARGVVTLLPSTRMYYAEIGILGNMGFWEWHRIVPATSPQVLPPLPMAIRRLHLRPARLPTD